MGIGKVSSLAVASLAKVNSLVKLSVNKINAVAASFAAYEWGGLKSLSHGSDGANDYVIATSTSAAFQFDQDDAWSVSFWIKVGWTDDVYASMHLISSNDGSSNHKNDRWSVWYNEKNNRLYIQWREGERKTQNFVYFHNGNTDEAGDVSNLYGWPTSTYWNASHRGYTNANDFTLITITKGTANHAGRTNVTMYWNSKSLGDLYYSGDSHGEANLIAMDDTQARNFTIGNNAWNYRSNGDGATLYDDVSLWNKELSQAEVAEIWNGTDAKGADDGTPCNLEESSMSANLIGYWTFENGGTTSIVGDATLTFNGASEAVTSPAG